MMNLGPITELKQCGLNIETSPGNRWRARTATGFFVILLCAYAALGRIASGQTTSGTYSNLIVTGTASTNNLGISGTLDAQGNEILFGAWSTDSSNPGEILIYNDGTSGTGASVEDELTRPGSKWSWFRQDDASTAMELSPSNQLILTGTQASAPGSIVIDPTAEEITINGDQVPTLSQIASQFMPLGAPSITATSSGWANISAVGSQAYLTMQASGYESALNFETDGNDTGDKVFRIDNSVDSLHIDKMADSTGSVVLGDIANFMADGDVAIGANGITFQTEGASGLATLGSLVFASSGTEFGSESDGWESNYVGGYPWLATRGGQLRLGGGLRGDSAVNGIIFLQNGTEVGRFYNGGNFGVGSSSPESVVTVEKDVAGARGGELSVVNMGGGAGAEAAINFGVDNSSYNADTGNAQIKAVNMDQTGNSDSALVVSTWNGSSFGERLRVSPSGALGVGTSAPGAELDVNGSTYMRGTVIVTGTMVSGTVVATGTNLVLIPQQGDLSMGSFTGGPTPQ